ncbi:g7789 [Coccomyxa elongata]
MDSVVAPLCHSSLQYNWFKTPTSPNTPSRGPLWSGLGFGSPLESRMRYMSCLLRHGAVVWSGPWLDQKRSCRTWPAARLRWRPTCRRAGANNEERDDHCARCFHPNETAAVQLTDSLPAEAVIVALELALVLPLSAAKSAVGANPGPRHY